MSLFDLGLFDLGLDDSEDSYDHKQKLDNDKHFYEYIRNHPEYIILHIICVVGFGAIMVVLLKFLVGITDRYGLYIFR